MSSLDPLNDECQSKTARKKAMRIDRHHGTSNRVPPHAGFATGLNRPAEMLATAPEGDRNMSNDEKLNYVRSHIKMAPFWRTAKAIIKSIPVSMIEPLTGEQLVVVADALHAAHESGKAKAEAEILAEGAIYSPKHERMLEIEVPNV